MSRPLGLPCLLYLSADRVCAPLTSRGGTVSESLSASEHRLARVPDPAIEAAMRTRGWGGDRRVRFPVPCLPGVEVLSWDLASRLLMAALLECREVGRVELRLAEPPASGWKRALGRKQGRVQVTLLPGPPLDGLCGRILERLERKGEQGTQRGLVGGGGVIADVRYELEDHGYVRRTRAGAIDDCERIQALAEERAFAVDWWNRAWADDAPLCHALLADCTQSTSPLSGGGG